MHIETNSIRLRDNLRTYFDHVMSTGDRVLITRHGKEIAALVTVKDFNALEKVENNRTLFMEARSEAQLRDFRVLKQALAEEG